VSPVRYEHCFYISEDGVLHSHRRENLKAAVYNFFLLRVIPVVISLKLCAHNVFGI
jgi:hypothetical protein